MIQATAWPELSYFTPTMRRMIAFMALRPGGSGFVEWAPIAHPDRPSASAGAWGVARDRLMQHGVMQRRADGNWQLSDDFARSKLVEQIAATRDGRLVHENMAKQRMGATLMDEQISGQPYPHNATMRATIPHGDDGVSATIEAMRAIVKHATGSPILQSIAGRLAARAGRKDKMGQVREVRDWARRVLLFKPDGFAQETLRIPEQLVAEIAEAGRTSADCDDSSMLIATLLHLMGWRTVFVVIATRRDGPFVHVFPGVVIRGAVVAIDAQEGFAIGAEAPSRRRRVFDVQTGKVLR